MVLPLRSCTKIQKRRSEKTWFRTKIQANKEKYQQVNNEYKTHLKNNKKLHIKGKHSDPKTNNTRAFYKTVKMLVDIQEKANCQKQITTHKMNLLSSS